MLHQIRNTNRRGVLPHGVIHQQLPHGVVSQDMSLTGIYFMCMHIDGQAALPVTRGNPREACQGWLPVAWF